MMQLVTDGECVTGMCEVRCIQPRICSINHPADKLEDRGVRSGLQLSQLKDTTTKYAAEVALDFAFRQDNILMQICVVINI